MTSLKGKYKYIIFDFDGTINNTAPGIHATMKRVCQHYGVDYSNIDFNEHIGPPLDYSYTTFVGKELCAEAMEMHVKVFAQTNAVKNSFLYEGIIQTLDALQQAGYTMAIASSKYQGHVDESLDYLNIGHYFVKAYGQNDKRGFKSEVLRQLIADLGWEKSQCVMIGDTLHDMHGAKDNGVDVIAVTYGFGKSDDLIATSPIAVANTPMEIAKILL